MLKAVIVASEEMVSKDLADKLNNYFAERVCFEALSLTTDVTGDIRRKDADLLVTVDLAGFDRTTFTDGIAYNLLDCKQVHLLLRENLENEKCLSKMLSIAMFFGCKDRNYIEVLRRNYPNIPWLKTLDERKDDGNQEIMINEYEAIGKLIDNVLWECHMGFPESH